MIVLRYPGPLIRFLPWNNDVPLQDFYMETTVQQKLYKREIQIFCKPLLPLYTGVVKKKYHMLYNTVEKVPTYGVGSLIRIILTIFGLTLFVVTVPICNNIGLFIYRK